MKGNLWKYLAIGLTIALVLVLLHNYFERKHHENENNNIHTDTLWVKRFKPVEPYKILEIPKLVYWYHIDTVKVKEIVASLDHIQLTLGNNQVLNYSTQFLAQYPNAKKLVQFTTSSNKLNLTQFDSQGRLMTDVYDFRPEFYNYNYTNGTLTSKPKGFFQKFGFSAELMYRPISNMFDANLGLIHKTSNSIYEVGLNTHYYPTFQTKIGFDPYIRVRFQI